MLDIYWWSVRLLNKTKAVFTQTKKLTYLGDRKLNSCHFDTKEAYTAKKSAHFFLS